MTINESLNLRFCAQTEYPPQARSAGFRDGAKGTHSSRTSMLDDLARVMTATPDPAQRADYVSAITDANCLGKPTASTRRLSAQRLSELYGLDPAIPLFRAFRHLWNTGIDGHPLLALLLALARDPLLAATAIPVVSLAEGAELRREALRTALQAVTGDRFNPKILDKVVRNTASSWTQSGHLEGRTFKRRRLVTPTVQTAALALYLGYTAGFRGTDLFASGWFAVLDCSPTRAMNLSMDAKRAGLIDLRISGEVVDLKVDRLDPQSVRVPSNVAH